MLKPVLALLLTINAAIGPVAFAAPALPTAAAPEASVLTLENLESSPTDAADADNFLPDAQSIQSIQITDLSFEQVTAVLASMPNTEHTEFVLSTNEDKVIQAVAQNQDIQEKFRTVLWLQKALTWVHGAAVNYKEAALNDKWGLVLTTVSFGYDSIKWVQCSHMSTLQTVSMLSFNFLLAASFGVQKDLWAKATKPIEKRVKLLLEKIRIIGSHGINPSSEQSMTTDISTKLVSSLILSASLQIGRTLIYNGDKMLAPENIARLAGTSLMLAGVLAYSQFAWDEQIATVNADEQPGAKFGWRRLKETRGLLMSYFSPSSKLMQPDKFSMFPWVVSFIHGTIGILVYSNSAWLSDKLESVMQKLPLPTAAKNRLWKSFGESEKVRCESAL